MNPRMRRNDGVAVNGGVLIEDGDGEDGEVPEGASKIL